MPKEFGLFKAIFYYLSFKRDAGRLEYFICINFAFSVTIMSSYGIFTDFYKELYGSQSGLNELIQLLHFPVYLYALIMIFSVTVRRLRYLSFSIWWVLLLPLGALLPVYFWVIFPLSLLLFSKEHEPILSKSTHAVGSVEKK